MVKNNIFILFILIYVQLFSNYSNLALVEFKDKGNNNQDINLPVYQNYIQAIKNLDLEYINASKWQNIAIFNYNDIEKVEQIKKLPFVKNIKFGCIQNKRVEKLEDKFEIENNNIIEENTQTNSDTFYLQQLLQLKGNYIQNLGFKGQNIKIAVIDNGFPNANNIAGLNHIYTENRLLGTYDFYNNATNVYFPSGANHGSNCFSIIGGMLYNYTGSAPQASFYLYRTEVDAIEGQTEEVLLSSALEVASDSGVQIASISLGYSDGFNDGTNNHVYAELDGKSTIAAKAVNIAASKGMLVCVAAGNEGNNSWKYLSTPADADSSFTIGAVDINGNIASFTGYNFDSTAKIKPNVAALGVSTAYLNGNNTISTGNGTSYATPIMAGLSACLWQAFPNKTNWEIKSAIEQSAHLYPNSNKRIGYGIPNFELAYQILAGIDSSINSNNTEQLKLYPNIVKDKLTVINQHESIDAIKVIDQTGKIMLSQNFLPNNSQIIDISPIPSNVYFIQVYTKSEMITKKIIKQ